MIDSLKAYEILKTAEIPQGHASAIVEVIGMSLDDNNLRQSKNLAAKHDLARLEGRTVHMETSLRQDLVKMEASLRVDFARECGRLEARISDTKSELLRWMFIFWAGQVAATVAIVFGAIRLLR